MKYIREALPESLTGDNWTQIAVALITALGAWILARFSRRPSVSQHTPLEKELNERIDQLENELRAERNKFANELRRRIDAETAVKYTKRQLQSVKQKLSRLQKAKLRKK